MNFFLLFIVAAALWGARIRVRGFDTADYLAHDHTTTINGIFILIVFYAHLRTYVPYNPAWDGGMYWLTVHLGQLMVALFLFYSGYGVAESLRHKPGYVHTMPAKRLGVTWVNFLIAQVLFVILDLALGRPFTPAQLGWALIGWKSIGASAWYIFAILVLYGLTWLTYTVVRDRPWIALAVMFVLVVAFTVFMWYFKGKAAYTYNTVLCYPLGMLYSLARPHFERVYTHSIGSPVAFLVTLGLFWVTTEYDSLQYMVFEAESMLFCLLAMQVTLKIHIESPVLHWFGKNLFWIYVLQRIPMIALRDLGFADVAPYPFAAICFAVTVALAWIMSRATKPLDAKIAALAPAPRPKA